MFITIKQNRVTADINDIYANTVKGPVKMQA
jgi:hypothetical protein